MSESVERRLVELLGRPEVSPYGNPIPGLDELLPGVVHIEPSPDSLLPLSAVAVDDVRWVAVRRIAEPIQDDAASMTLLHRVGAMPGATVKIRRVASGVFIGSAGEYTELPDEVAVHILVEPTAALAQA